MPLPLPIAVTASPARTSSSGSGATVANPLAPSSLSRATSWVASRATTVAVWASPVSAMVTRTRTEPSTTW